MITSKKAPWQVVVIGWASIVIGPGLFLLSLIGQIFATEQLLYPFGTYIWLEHCMENIGADSSGMLVLILGIGVSLIYVAVGYAALRLFRWARSALELSAWLAIVYWITNWAFWSWEAVTGKSPTLVLTIVVGAIITAVPCIVCAWVIRTLRSLSTRMVFVN